MGDLIEIVTVANQPIAFYKVSARAISFEVKTHNGASVGLAQSPGGFWEYIISFDINGRISVKGVNGVKTHHSRTYSLSAVQYKRFWLSWDSGFLHVGQGRESQSIISYPNNVTGLSYIIFTASDSIHQATWRFELSPASLIMIARTIPHKPVTGGELRWVRAEVQLPDDAVIGGFEGETLYIIRGPHSGSLTPGKFVPSEGVAYVSWGGAANQVSSFEVLCGYNFKWVPTHNDFIPFNAYVAGYSEVNHEKLYIGRVVQPSCLIPGKVQPSHKVCYIALDDKEKAYSNYEILTVPDSNPYAEGDYYLTVNNRDILGRNHPRMSPISPVVLDYDEEVFDDDDDDDDENDNDGNNFDDRDSNSEEDGGQFFEPIIVEQL